MYKATGASEQKKGADYADKLRIVARVWGRRRQRKKEIFAVMEKGCLSNGSKVLSIIEQFKMQEMRGTPVVPVLMKELCMRHFPVDGLLLACTFTNYYYSFTSTVNVKRQAQATAEKQKVLLLACNRRMQKDQGF